MTDTSTRTLAEAKLAEVRRAFEEHRRLMDALRRLQRQQLPLPFAAKEVRR